MPIHQHKYANVVTQNSLVSPFNSLKKNSKFVLERNLIICTSNSGLLGFNKVNDCFKNCFSIHLNYRCLIKCVFDDLYSNALHPRLRTTDMGGRNVYRHIKKSSITNWKEISKNWNSRKNAIVVAKVHLGLEGHARIRRITFLVNFRFIEMFCGAPTDSGLLSTHPGYR